MKAYFQAILYRDADPSWINIELVDVPGGISCARSLDEAHIMARDCLQAILRTQNILGEVKSYDDLVESYDKPNGWWLEFIEIDLPEEMIDILGIFITDPSKHFPTLEAKLRNDELRTNVLN